jgi:hypothetical protein
MNKKEEREVPVLTARDMRSTWLVQRLQKPFPSDSPFAKVQFVTCRKGQEGAARKGGA